MPEIFLSYRRADAPGSAGRLFSSLSERFGAEQVFRDLESIEAGENFEDAIRDAVGTATAVLIVIGPRWLETRRVDGKRRLDDPLDYVRREIELALSLDTMVIPVLVENATLPPSASLPASIRELTKRNAIELSDRRWDGDVQVLLEQLERSGIAIAEPGATREALTHRATTSAIKRTPGEFVLSFYALLRQPQRFLRRTGSAKVVNLTGAFVFFTVTLLLAILILISGYTPSQPAASFGLTIYAAGLVTTLAISAPLWAAWRLVGATRHYARILVILLHQSAILHLAILISVWLVIVALDLRSLNIVSDTMREALTPGRSLDVALETMRSALEPLAGSAEVRVALVVSALVLLGSGVWLILSWGAYRQTLGVSRARSATAFGAFMLIAGAIVLVFESLLAA